MEVGDADLLTHPFDQLAGVLADQALPSGGDEQGSFGASALGAVDGVRRPRSAARDPQAELEQQQHER